MNHIESKLLQLSIRVMGLEPNISTHYAHPQINLWHSGTLRLLFCNPLNFTSPYISALIPSMVAEPVRGYSSTILLRATGLIQYVVK